MENKMTKKELQEKLTEMGIQFKTKASVKELVELLAKAEAEKSNKKDVLSVSITAFCKENACTYKAGIKSRANSLIINKEKRRIARVSYNEKKNDFTVIKNDHGKVLSVHVSPESLSAVLTCILNEK